VLVVNRHGAGIVSEVGFSETDVLAAPDVSQKVPVANSVNVPLREIFLNIGMLPHRRYRSGLVVLYLLVIASHPMTILIKG
jgi:hypothetical protein